MQSKKLEGFTVFAEIYSDTIRLHHYGILHSSAYENEVFPIPCFHYSGSYTVKTFQNIDYLITSDFDRYLT